jgi:23S rRNA (uracil1939-C5)-methyltransferase/tRNA (uracil-5-)-methyltransferase
VEQEVLPVIGSPVEYGYRSKITPHFEAPRDGGGLREIGFLKAGRRYDLLDVPRCDIATDAINAVLPGIREDVRKRAATFKKGATLLLRDTMEGVMTDHTALAHEKVGPLEFEFLAGDFFQNNPFILEAFTSYAISEARAGGARYLVDAYCGSGLFALSAAPSFERVAGIELSESSIRFARQNATANNIANATFQSGDAATIFAGLSALATPERPDAFTPAATAVIIDPPRKGCDESFLTQLFAFAPRTVVYVSCDPATQMRDLKGFLTAGYTLTDVQPFDLFPQTRHLECVITLVK